MIINSKDNKDSKDMGMADSMDTGKDNSKDVDLMLPLVLIPLRIQMETQNDAGQTRSPDDQSRSQISYHFDSCA
jgi:hypothetical protein